MEQQISDGSLVALGREIVTLEGRTLLKVGESLKEDFERAVMELARCKGKIVTAGVGKSGLIAKKIASTLASLGSESFCLDVLDALHGDLGMISASDVVLLFRQAEKPKNSSCFCPSSRGWTSKCWPLRPRQARASLEAQIYRSSCP